MRKKKRRTSSDDAALAVADPSSDAESFGPWLRRQREGRGIDLREIADESKISLRYLEALESNRFEALPAPVFIKGFLRQYSSYVGLDAEEVVNYFLAAEAAIDERTRDDLPEELRIDKRPRRPMGVGVALTVLLVVALLLALAWWLTEQRRNASLSGGKASPTLTAREPSSTLPGSGDSSGNSGAEDRGAGSTGTGTAASGAATPDTEALEAADSQTVTSQTVESDVASSETPSTDAPDSESENSRVGDASAASLERATATGSKTVNVVVDFTGDCWVEASVDGQPRIAEMRVQGESLVLEGNSSVDLKVGNIDVVRLEVNGQPWPAESGGGSSVRQLRFDQETLAARSTTGRR